MSDPNTLGRLVRRRRLESGYSLGQLASKVGKTAAEVRAWERDAELPEHGIIERLAETLELDLDDIKARLEAGDKAAPEHAAGDEAKKTEKLEKPEKSEKAKKSKKPEKPEPEAEAPQEEPESEDVVAVAAETDEPVAAPTEVAEDGDDEPGFAVDDPFTPPAPETDAPVVAGSESAAEPDFDLFDAPTEAVPVPVITETATAARAERAVAVLEAPAPPAPIGSAPDADPGLLRYLEPVRILFDPNSRYLYWIRAGLTVVVMLILLGILFRQFGSLLDAVGELLDTIEPTATTPDDLDALGPFAR